jgi:hypothetical protein
LRGLDLRLGQFWVRSEPSGRPNRHRFETWLDFDVDGIPILGDLDYVDSEELAGEITDGRPKKVDIDKMHAYRDPIRDPKDAHAVDFAAIIYPGRNGTGLEAIALRPGEPVTDDIREALHAALVATSRRVTSGGRLTRPTRVFVFCGELPESSAELVERDECDPPASPSIVPRIKETRILEFRIDDARRDANRRLLPIGGSAHYDGTPV